LPEGALNENNVVSVPFGASENTVPLSALPPPPVVHTYTNKKKFLLLLTKRSASFLVLTP